MKRFRYQIVNGQIVIDGNPPPPAPCPAPAGPPMRMISETIIEEMLRSVVYEREHTSSKAAFERCERVLKEISR